MLHIARKNINSLRCRFQIRRNNLNMSVDEYIEWKAGVKRSPTDEKESDNENPKEEQQRIPQ